MKTDRSLAHLLAAAIAVCIVLSVEPLAAADSAAGKPVVILWPGGAPGAKGTADKDKPSLTVHLPAAGKANGCAVVICPGGGYQHLAMSYEGHDVAEWFNSFGVAGFVLKYRLAPDYHHPSPMLDVQRAIRTVRARAGEWNVDPDRIGVMGFSAGGHLASTAATHFNSGQSDAADPIDRQRCRPDFAVLAYPVITMTAPWGHGGSKKNLLGPHPTEELAQSLSNERQVSAETPPTFLFHTTADTGVPPRNSVAFYTALIRRGVPAELHIYEKGPHGVGLGNRAKGLDAYLGTWPTLLHNWMQIRGLLSQK